MKHIYTVMVITFLSLFIVESSYSQGCVAVRGNGASACSINHDMDSQGKKWQLNAGFRYFKSFRHFSGKEEHPERLSENTEVINYQSSLDLALTYTINRKWSVMIDVPILNNVRSSLYEHGLVDGMYIKRERRTTESFGLGDIRMAVYRWILDPAKSNKGNIQVGLGIKFATGEYDYQDYWYNVGPNGEPELRPVDQSIQLGDGGTGITGELNGYYNFSSKIGLYSNLYYLSNPREHNGVRTYRETLVGFLANEAIMSVPDQYMVRIGGVYSPGFVNNLSIALGARLEGIPVYDLIGGSGDFRRPGYVWSFEPGINYMIKSSNFFLSVPIAIVRNRTQSVTDKERTEQSGVYSHGDAAFADYLLNIGISTRF